MNRVKLIVLGFVAMLFLVGTGIAQQPYSDHCQTGLRKNVQYAAAAATTTALLTHVTGADIYACGYQVAQAGGTGTILLETGTGTLCGTGKQQSRRPIPPTAPREPVRS